MASRIFVQIFLVAFCISSGFAQDYAQAALKSHNDARARHQQTGSLSLSATLNAKALKCAQKNADRGYLAHDCADAQGYGENLAMGSGYTSNVQAAQSAVSMWYAEKKNYNYNNPGFASNTGHFTQVVWKSSTQLGCGVARGSNGYYTSCLYSPPGNYLGEFPKNVFPEK